MAATEGEHPPLVSHRAPLRCVQYGAPVPRDTVVSARFAFYCGCPPSFRRLPALPSQVCNTVHLTAFVRDDTDVHPFMARLGKRDRAWAVRTIRSGERQPPSLCWQYSSSSVHHTKPRVLPSSPPLDVAVGPHVCLLAGGRGPCKGVCWCLRPASAGHVFFNASTGVGNRLFIEASLMREHFFSQPVREANGSSGS